MNEASEIGVREAHALMKRLGIGTSALIETAYIDLLAQKRHENLPGIPPPR